MNEDKDLLNIQLRVADILLPLTVKRDEEEFYREAAKRIDSLLNRYRGIFPEQNREKYLIMVALHLSVICVKLEHKNDTLPFTTKIEELTQMLEEYLKTEME